MNYKKRQFIADPIWGQIELFPWETKILNHFVFNRLHDVMQNSCAYKVYPGLKYSRFLHSIGVLHTATEIFTNCIINIENELDRQDGPENLNSIYEKIKDEKKKVFKDEEHTPQENIICQRTKCPEKFALLLAVVRVAGLLHDLGHLPYSHVFEFALEEFLISPIPEEWKKIDSDNDRDRLEKLHESLKDNLGYGKKKNQDEKTPIHERIRKYFIQILIEDFKDDSFLKIVLKGTQNLWKGDLPICKSMLSEDIDADRSDFVCRDGEFSSLYKSSVDFERLFLNYELAFCKSKKSYGRTEEKNIKARPSKRANAETAKLLRERFLGYKYIITHHKVHLFDYILERLLIECIKQDFFYDLLKVLDEIFDLEYGLSTKKDGQYIEMKKNIKILFNDSYVNVKLQELYAATNKDSYIDALYETLTENRNKFISLLKSDESDKLSFLKGLDLETKFLIDNKCGDEKWGTYLQSDSSSEKTILVLMVGLAKKLKTGIDDENEEFYKLENLKKFLQGEILKSRPLNVWYYSEKGNPDTEIEKKILDFLKEKIKTCVSESKMENLF